MFLLASGSAHLDPFGAGFRLVLTIIFICIISVYLVVFLASVRERIRLGRRGYEEARYQGERSQVWWVRVGEKRWLKELANWGIVLEGDNVSETLKEINRSWEIVRPDYYNMLFILIAQLVVLIGIWTPIQPSSTQLFWQYLAAALPYSLFIIVVGIGYARGVSILRQEARGQLTYADLRERRLTDYRSMLFRLLPALFIVSLLLLTLLDLPYLNATLPIPLPGGSQLTISTWIVGVMLLAMLVVFIITEMQITRVVSLPRLLLLRSPEKAQQVDDLFRAKVIGELQSFELLSLVYFGLLTYLLLQAALSKAPAYTQSVTIIVFVLWLAVFMGVIFSKGRLGGKISGWPWRKRQHGKEALG